MRFRPANIRLINRRSNLPRLLLALFSINSKSNDNRKNNPTDVQRLTGSLHIRAEPWLLCPVEISERLPLPDSCVNLNVGGFAIQHPWFRFEPSTSRQGPGPVEFS